MRKRITLTTKKSRPKMRMASRVLVSTTCLVKELAVMSKMALFGSLTSLPGLLFGGEVAGCAGTLEVA